MIKAIVTEYIERSFEDEYEFFKKFNTKEEAVKFFKSGKYVISTKEGYDLERTEYDSDIDKYWHSFVKFEEITD